MGTAVQLAEVGVCIVGISHQSTLEFIKEFFNHLALPATKEVIADLRRQVDDDPHVTLHVLERAVIHLYLGPHPSLIAVDARTHLQKHLLDVLLTTLKKHSSFGKPVQNTLLRHTHLLIEHAVHLAAA